RPRRQRRDRLSRGLGAAAHGDPKVAVADRAVEVAELVLLLRQELERAVEEDAQLGAGHSRKKGDRAGASRSSASSASSRMTLSDAAAIRRLVAHTPTNVRRATTPSRSRSCRTWRYRT